MIESLRGDKNLNDTSQSESIVNSAEFINMLIETKFKEHVDPLKFTVNELK